MITNHASNIFWDINRLEEQDNKILFLNSYYKSPEYSDKYHTDQLIYLMFLAKDSECVSFLDHRISGLSSLSQGKSMLIDNFNIGSNLCYVFEICDVNYKIDYNTIIKGNYSKISPQYKERILRFNDQYSTERFTSAFSRNQVALKNLHKELGCMKTKCTCLFSNFKRCNNFRDFDFDYEKQELLSKFSDKEELRLDNLLNKSISLENLIN
jgi:hypothetical protein